MKTLFRSLVSVIALLVVIPQAALAVGLYSGDQVTVQGVQNQNVYAAGGMVRIIDNVVGDIVVAGGMITIDGNVTGDVLVAGGQVTINGSVSDDVTVFGGTVTLNGRIGGDLAGAAGQITLSKKAEVARDVVMGGGLFTIDGTVQGSFHAVGGTVLLSGQINGDAKVQYGEMLTLSPGSRIAGNLYYVAGKEMQVPEGIVAGQVVYTPSTQLASLGKDNAKRIRVWDSLHLWSLITSLLIGLLFVIFAKQAVVRLGGISFSETAAARFGWGLLAIVAGPVLAVMLFVTVFGIPLGVIALLLWGILLYLGTVFANLIVGTILMPVDLHATKGRIFGTFVVGGIILTVIRMIPVIGGIVTAVAIVIAVGAMVKYRMETLKALRRGGLA